MEVHCPWRSVACSSGRRAGWAAAHAQGIFFMMGVLKSRSPHARNVDARKRKQYANRAEVLAICTGARSESSEVGVGFFLPALPNTSVQGGGRVKVAVLMYLLREFLPLDGPDNGRTSENALDAQAPKHDPTM